jgi:ubiquinone/menaquinone biosynthesis C-methylase UbiE
MNKKTETQEFWNSNPCSGNWSSVEDLISWRNATEPYINELLEDIIKPRHKVLEVGCGQGIEFMQNLQKNINLTGIDYSKKSLLKAKSNIAKKFSGKTNKKFFLINGDAENLPFKDSQFDVVYSIGVLHHTPDTQKGINEIHRILKEDGIAVVMMYHRLSWRSFPISVARSVSKILDNLTGKDRLIYNVLIRKYSKKTNSNKGTTTLELFGCPILKMYTKNQMKSFFSEFSSTEIKCYSSNLFQLSYFIPIKFFSKFLMKIDKKIDNIFGFHLVAVSKK